MSEEGDRIAVVDDEPSMCRALKRLLTAAGYKVNAFVSGEDFLRSLPERVPDYVVLDLHMPGLTGFEVQERLAEARIPVHVIVITGHDSPEARERTLSGGAAAYLCKPVSEEVLLAAIEQCRARCLRPGIRPGTDGRTWTVSCAVPRENHDWTAPTGPVPDTDPANPGSPA